MKCARKGCDHEAFADSIFCNVDRIVARPSDTCDNLPAIKDNVPASPTIGEYMDVVDRIDALLIGRSTIVTFTALTTLCRVKAMQESMTMRKIVASAMRRAADEICPPESAH